MNHLFHKNSIIGVPKIKNLSMPPCSKHETLKNQAIHLNLCFSESQIQLFMPIQIGVLENDLLYIYLSMTLQNLNNSYPIQALNNKKYDFFDSKFLLEKAEIQTNISTILTLMNKKLGGSAYKWLYKSNIILAQSLLSWRLLQVNSKIIQGASSLIDFNMDNNTNEIIVRVNLFYLYYLFIPYRNRLKNLVNKNLAAYTLINVRERFQLKQELQRYVHEWLSHNIFPNGAAYRVKIDDIVSDIQLHKKIASPYYKTWLKNTRYSIGQAIKSMCTQLDNWTLSGVWGRGKTRTYQIQRKKLN